MNTFFRIFALVFALLFLLAVAVQYNDPDALIWYIVYGLAAIASLLFFFGKLKYYMAALLCTAYLLGSFIVWPEVYEGLTIGEGDIVNVERGREAIGLLLISAIMLIYALRLRFRSNS